MTDISLTLADTIQKIAVYALPLLFGITWHVAAQCFLAHRMGDRTAQMEGRLSLNPIKHIDPIGSIALPIIGYIILRLTGFGLLFGYAKPLPINFGNMKNPRRGMLWVALVGIAANFAMAAAWHLLQICLLLAHIDEPFFIQMAVAGESANLVLIGFFLIPLPPFDGSRIVYSLLPDKQAYEYAKIEPYTMIILFILLIPGWLWTYWVIPWARLWETLLHLLFIPLILLLK